MVRSSKRFSHIGRKVEWSPESKMELGVESKLLEFRKEGGGEGGIASKKCEGFREKNGFSWKFGILLYI